MHNTARRPRCSRATLFGKFADVQFPPLRVHTLSETSVRSAAWLFSIGGDGIMNLRRFTKVAPAFCGTVVLAGWIVAWLAGFGSASSDNTRAVPIENRAASLAANAELADKPQAIPMGNPVIASADVAAAVESVTAMAADTTAASDEPESIVVAALPDPSQMLPPETPPVQVATANPSDLVPNDVKDAVSRIEIQDECLVAETCIDRFLWALYERTPKLDMIKVQELRKVTVKKRGKTKTVTKTFTRLVDNDFTWKDPKAADKVGMTMMDYVIGGMDRSFKLKLFYTLYAAEQAGLSPGITSAFRDDYRQSIISGLKAANDRSYHGGSFHGGYGHGLAADVVSIKGATRAQRWISTESFWKWIDANGKEFGIGRPYLDRDPPHLAPIDGKEYASHRGGTKAQHAESDIKKRKRLAVRDDHSVKTPKNRKIVEGANDPTRFKQAFKQDAGSKATKLKSVAISQAPAPARAGSAARYTNRGAISGRPTMAALKRS
jgi:hypothetical protein